MLVSTRHTSVISTSFVRGYSIVGGDMTSEAILKAQH